MTSGTRKGQVSLRCREHSTQPLGARLYQKYEATWKVNKCAVAFDEKLFLTRLEYSIQQIGIASTARFTRSSALSMQNRYMCVSCIFHRIYSIRPDSSTYYAVHRIHMPLQPRHIPPSSPHILQYASVLTPCHPQVTLPQLAVSSSPPQAPMSQCCRRRAPVSAKSIQPQVHPSFRRCWTKRNGKECNVPGIRLPCIRNGTEQQTAAEAVEPDAFPTFVLVLLLGWDAPEPAGLLGGDVLAEIVRDCTGAE